MALSAATLHAGERPIDPELLRQALRQAAGAEAFWQPWADQPLHALAHTGTDHQLFRLGAQGLLRVPRVAGVAGQVQKDARWLPLLAAALPLAVPHCLALLPLPSPLPGPAGLYRWLPGRPLYRQQLDSLDLRAANCLGACLRALRALPTPTAAEALAQALQGPRGQALTDTEGGTSAAIEALQPWLDAGSRWQLRAIWIQACEAPPWQADPVWFHGDLLPANLLWSEQAELQALIDWGGLGVGDPACDLMPAWALFSGPARQAFREAAGLDEACWQRARGHALRQAAYYVPYYQHSNPLEVARALDTLAQLLTETG